MTTAHDLPHPGTITFVDGTTQEISRQADASDVPFGVAFVEVEDGAYRPVVRVEAVTSPDKRVILQYGPDGELLKSTLQLRGTEAGRPA